MSSNGSSPVVKSADRTVQLLEHLAGAQGSHSLNQLHQDLGIPKSSLHGLLRTLMHHGWIETDRSGTRFKLGVRALLVGTSYIDGDEVVRATAHVMDELGEDTAETIHLGRLDTGPPVAEVVYLATRQSRHHLRMFSRVGRRLPAHATALGKAMLAGHPDENLEVLLSEPLPALTSHTICNLPNLRKELEVIRTRGYAMDWEENTVGIGCVGVALPLIGGTSGAPRDAISVSVPLARFSEQRAEDLAGTLIGAIESLRPGISRI